MSIFPLEFLDNTAIIDGDTNESLTYQELMQLSKKIENLHITGRALIFIFNTNRVDEVIAYIAAMNAGHVVCLLDANINPEFKAKLVDYYSPHIIFSTDSSLWKGYQRVDSPWKGINIFQANEMHRCPTLHPELALLMTTSGTTGNPKLIRLSRQNLIKNAHSINQYLQITKKEIAIASLPFHYSYGLSVLHTHLLAGAAIVLTQKSVAQRDFWELMQKHACTSLAGVPYTYKIMERIGFDTLELPALRTLTQAGGHLDSQSVRHFHEIMQNKGGRLFVMYGQTEATARIAYLPPELLPKKADAIGIAIPGGILKIDHEELIYQGPNVMLGYAESPTDLQKGDEMNGVLHTGDLGYCDGDGIFYITGRAKRISKTFGLRINLDDLEKALSSLGNVAVISRDEIIHIYIENGSIADCENAIKLLTDQYRLHPSALRCHSIDKLPRTSSGKIDYTILSRE